MARAAFLALAALLACDRAGHPADAPSIPTPGAIHVVATVNSLDQSCEVAGGDRDAYLLLDGADVGWFYPGGRLVEVAPGAHEVAAQCLTCDGTVLGEATAKVVVVASGETSEVRLDVVAPVAQGAVTITWDGTTCRTTTAFVQSEAYTDGSRTTCRFSYVNCNDGAARIEHLLPGMYSFIFCEAPTCELCCDVAGSIVVPEGPVAPDAILVGPLDHQSCVGTWCTR